MALRCIRGVHQRVTRMIEKDRERESRGKAQACYLLAWLPAALGLKGALVVVVVVILLAVVVVVILDG